MKTSYEDSTSGIVRHIADIGRDIAELAELQLKLFVSDSRDAWRHAMVPCLAIVFAVTLLLGTIPVALMAGASALETGYGLSKPMALTAVSAGGLVGALVIAGVAWVKLRQSLMALDRSRSELSRNIDWLKQTLSREAERPSTVDSKH